MKVKAICDNCDKKIMPEDIMYYRKGYYSEEDFCSRECLKAYVIDNLQIREKMGDTKENE
jgi:hypothetical protein